MSSGQRPGPYPIAGAWGRVGWGDLDYRVVVLQTDVMMCDNACMGPRKVDRGHARDVDRSRPRAAVTQEGQRMIRMVTTVEVVPGHEGAWEEAWRTLREARSRYPGFACCAMVRGRRSILW